jgi:hypothetical protein
LGKPNEAGYERADKRYCGRGDRDGPTYTNQTRWISPSAGLFLIQVEKVKPLVNPQLKRFEVREFS